MEVDFFSVKLSGKSVRNWLSLGFFGCGRFRLGHRGTRQMLARNLFSFPTSLFVYLLFFFFIFFVQSLVSVLLWGENGMPSSSWFIPSVLPAPFFFLIKTCCCCCCWIDSFFLYFVLPYFASMNGRWINSNHLLLQGTWSAPWSVDWPFCYKQTDKMKY